MIDRTYCSAADMARETGHDRTTIAKWIKQGRIKSVKRANAKCSYRIYLKYFAPKFIDTLKKANIRSGKTWTATEVFMLKNNLEKDADTLNKLIKHRTKKAIIIKKCRIRKEGGNEPKT